MDNFILFLFSFVLPWIWLVNDRLGFLRFCKPSSKIGHGVGYCLQEWLGVHIGLFLFYFDFFSFAFILESKMESRV